MENVKKRCYICRGILSKERIRHFHEWRDKIICFENLEVEKCSQCGEVFLDPATIEMIDSKADEIFRQDVRYHEITIPVVAIA